MIIHFLIKKDKSTWDKEIENIVERKRSGNACVIDRKFLNEEELADFQKAVERREVEIENPYAKSYKESLLTIIKDDQEAYLEEPNCEESMRMIPYIEKLITAIEASV